MNEVTWNPWKGCEKCSEGCLYCRPSLFIRENKSQLRLPISKKHIKGIAKNELPYRIESGTIFRVCTTSDFFIEGADTIRNIAWGFIHERYECLFHIVTKRPERIPQSLPDTWLGGWDNVIVSVTVENEDNAWKRIPILLELPIRHMALSLEPLLENIDISPFLSSGLIETVIVSGESYTGYEGMAREINIEWVKNIQEQCKYFNTNFVFNRTGSQLKLTDYKRPIYVRERDEHNLAEFYKLDYTDDSVGSWEANIKEIEQRHITEQAFKVYKQLTLKDLGLDMKGE